MRAWWILTRRELGSHFVGWTGYVVLAMVAFLVGLTIVVSLTDLNSEPVTQPLVELFFGTSYVFLILVSPLTTMRSFSLEKSSGTFETLMTAPVSDVQVVLAKFAGTLAMFLVAWTPWLACLFALRHYVHEPGAADAAKLGTSLLGIFLLGLMYTSAGCFASALTRSQMSAAMIAYAIGISLYLLSFVADALPPQIGWPAQVFNHLNMREHMKDFARGVIDTRAISYYLSTTFLFLYFTLKVVETRRWR